MTHARFVGVVASLAVGVLALVVLAAGGRAAYATVPVTIDGSRVLVPRGTSVIDLVREHSVARPGSVRSAADGRVVVKGAGGPVRTLVNGGKAPLSVVLRSGDSIRTFSGADMIEPVVDETRTVDAPPRTIGEGPQTTILVGGDPGLERLRRGAVSGDLLECEMIAEPRPGLVRRTPSPGSRIVALTFDDGPWPKQTQAVLRILAEKNVPATFFMLGTRVHRAPDVAREVVEAGHTIGNHTWWHPRLDTMTTETIVREVAGANKVIRDATGVSPRWFRPPGGRYDERVTDELARVGMRQALWTVDPRDWRDGATADDIVKRVLEDVRPGAIVVLHDGGGDRGETIEALPRLIDALREQGYQFVTLDEMERVKDSW